MSYTITHSRTWLNPTDPGESQCSEQFEPANAPYKIDETESIETFTSEILQAERLRTYRVGDFLFWGYNKDEADCWLTFTASYDPLFGVIELYTDWQNQFYDTITRYTIPAEEHGFYNFHVSNVVENSNDPADVDFWYELPKTLTWDNHKDQVGSAPHIYVQLRMEGAPYGLKVHPLPFGNLPEILSLGQRSFF